MCRPAKQSDAENVKRPPFLLVLEEDFLGGHKRSREGDDLFDELAG